MEIKLEPGRYVLAVSGGVDSMALLDMLAGVNGLELIVAHFNHGIREDSDEDQELVAAVARQHGMPFVFARGDLGLQASEATARKARYDFLRRVRVEQGASAIITAHHQDDVLETAIINLLRGTGPRGLSSLRSTEALVRPLLAVPKRELIAYATARKLTWREDSTNRDERYLRNYVRRQIVPRLAADERQRFLGHIGEGVRLTDEIDRSLTPWANAEQLDRGQFIQLPYDVSRELLAAWLRHHNLPFDRKSLHRLTVFAKTAAAHQQADIGGGHYLAVSKNHIIRKQRAHEQ